MFGILKLFSNYSNYGVEKEGVGYGFYEVKCVDEIKIMKIYMFY